MNGAGAFCCALVLASHPAPNANTTAAVVMTVRMRRTLPIRAPFENPESLIPNPGPARAHRLPHDAEVRPPAAIFLAFAAIRCSNLATAPSSNDTAIRVSTRVLGRGGR